MDITTLARRAAAVFSCEAAGLAAAFLCLAVTASAGSAPAQAADSDTPAGSRNVYVAGGSVRAGAPVTGDFVAFGGRVVSDQPVAGDALLVGGSVDVRAPVGDDLRAAGGDVTLEAEVGGEVLAAGGKVTLTRAARVGRGASLAGGVVTIEGRIVGALHVSAQHIVLDGEVSGDARLVAEQIELGPNARIGGALSHASSSLVRSASATIGGAITIEELPRRDRERHRSWEGTAPTWAGLILGYLGLLAACAVLVLVFPNFSAGAPGTIRGAPWLALAIGFGVVTGVPVLAVLLFVTLLGIPLGIAALALYPLLLLTGYLSGVLFVAERLRSAVGRAQAPSFRSTMGFVALALLALLLVGRLPFVGGLTVFITTVVGIGACVIDWQRRRRPPTPLPA